MEIAQIITLADQRKLAYRCYGAKEGQPLYFFHGFPGSRLQAAIVEQQARAAGICIVAPDRPGFGRSDLAPQRRIADWPADVAQLADALGHARFGVLGVSCGGPYALACAERIAPRLTYVGLMAGVGAMDVPATRRNQFPALRMLFALARVSSRLVGPMLWLDRRMFVGNPERAVRMLAGMLTAPDRQLLANDPGLAECFAHSLAEAYAQGIAGAACEAHLIATEPGFDAHRINLPVHLYQGGQDRHVTPAMTGHLAGQLPGARLRFHPDEGHLSILPHAFPECVADYLAAMTPPPQLPGDQP